MGDNMLESSVHDIHGLVEADLAMFHKSKMTQEDMDKWRKKNPAAFFRAKYNAIEVGQRIKRDGEGSMASQHKAMAGLLKLGIQDQIKLLQDLASKNIELGIKMGYKPEEVREAKVIPEVKGENRLKE